METKNQQGIVEVVSEKIWKFFSSVKLAVILLIILAIVSVIGTVIQQNQSPEEYLQEYTQGTVDLFETLGFFDLYHTWWFVLLLLLFTANLTVCTLERFPYAWKAMRAPLKPIEEDAVKALPFRKDVTLKTGVEQAESLVLAALGGKRYRTLVSKESGGTGIASQKGAFSRMGVYITHVSILLIFTGALIGAFFGYKGFLNIPEGEASAVVYLRNEPLWDKIMSGLGISKSPVSYVEGRVPALPLGFYVALQDFEVDYYVNQGRPTGMPSEYWSILSVYDQNRQKVLDKRIRVNDPLTHHGITFYQSSYGTIPNATGTVKLGIRPKTGGATETVEAKPGASVYVPSIDRTIRVTGVMPYGMRDPMSGRINFYQSRNDELINPVVDLEVFKGKSTQLLYRTQVMKIDSQEPNMPENYTIGYQDYWGVRYTGLQVTKDPGVWVVYLGFILLCVGPVIAFFGSHRKVWARIQEKNGQAVVLLAGSSNRNRIAFEREFARIAEDIAKK
ncbi:MAG: cytochrome c biogenesis protein ResB [Nitrospiraceae bacterium]|nr:cytochrome c biogenesis protein ResB [Nitrospiraceae bacterium]